MVKPKIIIERKRSEIMRIPYYVFLDGKKIGALPDGRTIIFDAEPGEHRLMIRADWIATTPDVTFNAGNEEVKTFRVSSRYAPLIIPLLTAAVLFGVLVWLSVNERLYGLAMIPLVVLLLLYLRLNRKQMLRLDAK